MRIRYGKHRHKTLQGPQDVEIRFEDEQDDTRHTIITRWCRRASYRITTITNGQRIQTTMKQGEWNEP